MREVSGPMDRLTWMRRAAGGAALLSLVAMAMPAKAGPILDITGTQGMAINFGGALTVGWDFTVTKQTRIKGLGLWDEGSDGFRMPHIVALYRIVMSNPMLTRLVMIDSMDTLVVPSESGLGRWVFDLVDPITLFPGQQYVLAAGGGFGMIGGDLFRIASTITTIPQVTFGGCRFTAALAFPASMCAVAANPGAFGPNLLLASEPVSMAVLGVGLSALGLMARRRRTVASR